MGILDARACLGALAVLSLFGSGCSGGSTSSDVALTSMAFACRAEIGTGTSGQRAVLAADFTGDRIDDLLVASTGDRRLVLLVAATAGGPFSTTAGFSRDYAEEPGELVAGDFDADGDLDVACRFASDRRVRWLRNDGQGRFADQPQELECGPRTGLLAADLDGDRFTDLVLTAADGREVRLHRAGQRGFAPGLVLGDDPRCDFTALAAADWNGDGRLDLAACDHALARVVVWYQDATGFDPTRRQLLANPGSGAAALCAFDLDLDGRIDLAVANQGSGSLTVWRGDGQGNFLPPLSSDTDGDPRTLTAGDVLSLGRPQLVAGFLDRPEVALLRLDALGRVVEERHYAAAGAVTMTSLVDLDDDGWLDVVAAVQPGSGLAWLRGGGHSLAAAESFASSGDEAAGLLIHDWNGDGSADALLADRAGAHCRILAGRSDDTLVPADSLAVGAAPSALAGGDFDGDGRRDAVLAEANGVRFLLDRSAGGGIAFEVVPAATEPAIDCGAGPLALTAWRASALGIDFAAVLATATGSLSVVRRQSGVFRVVQRLETAAAASTLVALRFAGNDPLGLALLRPDADSILLLASDRHGRLRPLRDLAIAGLEPGLAAADLDADGRDELIGRARDGLFVRGSGAGDAVEVVWSGSAPLAVALTGDLNADRRPDLLATLPGSADLLVLIGDGRRGVAGAQWLPAWPDAAVLARHDADADGRADLFLAGAAGGRLGVLRNRTRSSSIPGGRPAN